MLFPSVYSHVQTFEPTFVCACVFLSNFRPTPSSLWQIAPSQLVGIYTMYMVYIVYVYIVVVVVGESWR